MQPLHHPTLLVSGPSTWLAVSFLTDHADSAAANAPAPAAGGVVRHAYVNDAAVDSFLADNADSGAVKAPAPAAGGVARRAYVNDAAVDSFLADYADSGAVKAPAPAAGGVVGKQTTLRRKYVNVIEDDEESNA
jgi:hypothetical protein